MRSLARFQGFPEDGSPDEITKALQALLKGDRNKDVRKAVLSSIAVMDGTVDDIVERTRDVRYREWHRAKEYGKLVVGFPISYATMGACKLRWTVTT